MESHQSQPSMESLLHDPSPVEGNQDILQSQHTTLDEPFISLHDGADLSFSEWTQFTPHLHTSDLQEKVQALGELRLLEPTAMDNLLPIERFMNDNSSSRPLVELNNLNSLSGESHSCAHNSHLSIATPWRSYHGPYNDSADASSGSSLYDYTFSTEDTGSSLTTGSPGSNHFQDVNFDNPGASSDFHCGHSHGGSQSNRSSTDGVSCLPPSPGMNRSPRWGVSGFSIGSSPDITRTVTQITVASGHCLGQDSSFVNLKSIQLSPATEEKDDPAQEGLTSRGPHSSSIPNIYVNGREHSDHEHENTHDHDHTSIWDTQNQYYIPSPMEVERSPPSPKTSPQISLRTAAKLEAKRESRRPKSSLQPSTKARAELMKPHKDATTSLTGKTNKGRGAGKKTKEKQRCPEHPNKEFRHNSDYRKHMQTKHTRPFLCTYYFAGCERTFGSKNEWKRHVFSQHLQLYYWRCDYLECADRKAFFNRKDLFGQHLKRMHGPKPGTCKDSHEKAWLTQEVPKIQERCRKTRRSPPEWSKCGYCGEKFNGEGSWDARMEHVGKHYEKNNYKDIDTKLWVMDEGLIKWSIKEGIVERTADGYKLREHGKNSLEEGLRRTSRVATMEVTEVMDIDDEVDADGEYDDNEY